MAIDFVIDPRQRIVFARAHGKLGREDLFRYQAEVWALPEVVGFDEIADLSDVLTISYEDDAEILELARTAVRKDAPDRSNRLAIVAPSDFSFGIAQMYGALRSSLPGSNREVKVFRGRADALSWLGAVEPA